MVLTEEERKERRKIASKKYRESEKGKKYLKTYIESDKGKGKLKERQKTEKYKEYQKEYHKEYSQSIKYKNSNKKYRESEAGKKARKKTRWKSRGVKLDNFEEIYERYTNAIFCDICECVLNVEGNNNTVKCLDHDHDTGDFRNIVCSYCNIHICK